MSSTTLRSLFGYKAWANRELFAMLAGLAPEHAEQLHTCIRTLNHIYVVDRIFQAHLSGDTRPFDATNTKSTPVHSMPGSMCAEAAIPPARSCRRSTVAST
jgi:uncharacterized damage-inducible protein DinB